MPLSENKYRAATVFSGIYYGLHEFPRLEPDDTAFSFSTRPHFNELGALGARVDLTIPLTTQIEFVTGVRYYSSLQRDDLPDDWSLLVGVSLPIGRIVRDLLSTGE